ncbi:hypothetical protein GCM10012275_28380 [Longimycelium tulufanense]|uniref:Uncharacterized protein n=1 Tax=Longimycelium tulufanense TaxID=907463 RepID=A0A8J3CEX4_9PSEU|nr:hypothetical protein [Longimycelium tulufanense]GGM55605.1 hypothetical protein GCM10012275_28380 [Longimycelium tulufanense]
MATTFVGAANTTTDNSATVPTGVQDGDICLVFCYRQDTGGSTGTGFAQVFTRDLTSSSITVLVKEAAGEGTSWTTTDTNATVSIAFRNARIPATWNQVSAASGDTGTLTGVTAGSTLLDVFSSWNTTGAASTHNTPTNYTAPADGSVTEEHGAGNMRASTFYRLDAPAGDHSVSNTNTSTVNGSGLIELPAVTDATGTLDATAPAASSSMSGAVIVAGDLASTAPAATSSASGEVTVAGDLSPTAPAATAAFEGEIPTAGTLDTTAPAANASMSGTAQTIAATGSLSATAPAASSSFEGTKIVPSPRTIVVPAEDRTFAVPAETRRVVVPAENRVYVVPKDRHA